MNHGLRKEGISLWLASGLLIWLGISSGAWAQQAGAQGQTQQQQPASKPSLAGGASQAPAAAAPAETAKVDPKEEAAYKGFYDLNPNEVDKEIQLGEDFVAKYPKSHYLSLVYSRLTNAYFDKRDVNKMQAAGEKALALNPDDVSVLTLVGWVIPHAYDPTDPAADAKLAKAQQYETHALELLPKVAKPASLTDEQFAKTKAEATSQAHSGLGLVYFREQKFAQSVSELQQAVQAIPDPDPTDLYVMGLELQSLNRYGEAADAFDRCAKIPGSLQDRCRQNSEQAKKQAATQPAPPKP